MNLVKKLNELANNRGYWLTFIAGGLSLLAVALYYQHMKDELPCIVCIQIRLWVSLWLIVSIVGLLFRQNIIINRIVHVSVVGIAIGLVERSYLLLGTERGFIFGDCGFSLGLPDWFAIETWMPWLFQVETSCGYTPEIFFGITMAEVLIVFSSCLLLLSVFVVLARFIQSNR